MIHDCAILFNNEKEKDVLILNDCVDYGKHSFRSYLQDRVVLFK